MSMSMSSSTSTNLSLSLRAAPVSTSSPNRTSMPMNTMPMPLSSSSFAIRPPSLLVRPRRIISCEVAVEESESSQSTSSSQVGAPVKVKVPVKVYHIPKVPELDLTGMEGKIKQYVGLWKGKRISANLPYKVEFVTDIQGRGPVKFFAHLKEDEFEYL